MSISIDIYNLKYKIFFIVFYFKELLLYSVLADIFNNLYINTPLTDIGISYKEFDLHSVRSKVSKEFVSSLIL